MIDSAVKKVIDVAKQEIGYLEKKNNSQLDDKTANAGDKNWTKYARDLDALGVYHARKNGYAWCDIFVDWCMIQAFGLNPAMQITGQPMAGYGAGCTESANYYKRMGQFFTSNPKPGDQIFFSNDKGKSMSHTGLVIKVTKDNVYTIEGNTSSAAGVVPNGGAVRDKVYSITYPKIGGYGRPKYKLVEEDEDMTQETFNKMLDNYLLEKTKLPATFEQEALVWNLQNGLMMGDQTGNQKPKSFMTRGEFAVVLKRFYDKFMK